jgi:hypothetical protein
MDGAEKVKLARRASRRSGFVDALNAPLKRRQPLHRALESFVHF